MAMKLSDPILAKPRGDKAAALAYLDRPDAKDREYVAALWKWCDVAGVDPAIAYAWAMVETADLTSVRWNRDLNPSGISVTFDDTVQPFTIPSADAAARLQVQCLYSLVKKRLHPDIPLEDELLAWMNRVWLPKAKDPRFPNVTRLTDLDVRYTDSSGTPHATWAWGHVEGQPAEEAIRRASRIWPNLPDAQPLPDIGEPPVPPQNPQNPPVTTIVHGRVPKPPIIDMIVRKRGNGAGYYEVAPRQIVGGCRHITAGLASIEWYHGFFSIGGERAEDALVDFIIDRQGRIAMFNDPFGTRSPWANGGSDGLEGDGAVFVQTLGVAAINARLFSVEHIGRDGDAMTDAQLEASAHLWAWIFDGASGHPRAPRVPWNSYPVNPAVGINTDLEHWEFATKPCPGSGMRGQTTRHQTRVKEILKQYQEVSIGEPPPAPEPQPVPVYPPGMTVQLASRLYRSVKVPWSTKPFSFDIERSECRAWLDRGKAQLDAGEDYTAATWPPIMDVIRRGDGGRVYHFSDGWSYAQAPREV